MTVHSKLRNLFVAAGVAGAVGVSGIAQAGTTWDMPIVWPDGNFHTKNARMFAEEVKKATGSELDANVDQPGSLFVQGDHGAIALRNIRIKVLD